MLGLSVVDMCPCTCSGVWCCLLGCYGFVCVSVYSRDADVHVGTSLYIMLLLLLLLRVHPSHPSSLYIYMFIYVSLTLERVYLLAFSKETTIFVLSSCYKMAAHWLWEEKPVQSPYGILPLWVPIAIQNYPQSESIFCNRERIQMYLVSFLCISVWVSVYIRGTRH